MGSGWIGGRSCEWSGVGLAAGELIEVEACVVNLGEVSNGAGELGPAWFWPLLLRPGLSMLCCSSTRRRNARSHASAFSGRFRILQYSTCAVRAAARSVSLEGRVVRGLRRSCSREADSSLRLAMLRLRPAAPRRAKWRAWSGVQMRVGMALGKVRQAAGRGQERGGRSEGLIESIAEELGGAGDDADRDDGGEIGEEEGTEKDQG